jgi:SHAQKYF class myb-like DNA-binding protein
MAPGPHKPHFENHPFCSETCRTFKWPLDKRRTSKFLEAIRLYGKNWKKVKEYVGTRSMSQARSHAQKYFAKLQQEAENGSSSSECPL